MASILDMLTGALGVSNPLNAGGGSSSGGGQNPYVLASQLAATPQNQPTPGYVQGAQITDPNQAGPSLNPTQTNPAYSALQNQEQKAFADQQSQARSMALLNAGAAMLSARNPYGGPASFGEALGAGIPAGIQGLTQAEQRNLLQGRALLEAQNVGRQGALANQQLQQGQYTLNDMQRFSQLLGFSSPQYANAYLARLNGQAAAQQLQGMLQDPKLSQDTKNRILLELPGIASGQVKTSDIVKSIFGTPINPVREKEIEQQTKTSATAAGRNVAATHALENLSGKTATTASIQDIIKTGGPEVAAAVAAQSSGKPISDPGLARAIQAVKVNKVGIGDHFSLTDAHGHKTEYINLGEYVVPYSSGLKGYDAGNRKKIEEEKLAASLSGLGDDVGAVDVPSP